MDSAHSHCTSVFSGTHVPFACHAASHAEAMGYKQAGLKAPEDIRARSTTRRARQVTNHLGLMAANKRQGM
jgi:hypothetical protein